MNTEGKVYDFEHLDSLCADIKREAIATCAAGPWQDGPPPKDGKIMDEFKKVFWVVEQYLNGAPLVIWWNERYKDWFISGTHIRIYEESIKRHAPINLPEEGV